MDAQDRNDEMTKGDATVHQDNAVGKGETVSMTTSEDNAPAQNDEDIYQYSAVLKADFQHRVFKHELMETTQRLEQVEHQDKQLTLAVKELTETLKGISDRLDVLASKTAALENASDELTRQSEHSYRTRVIEPLVRSVFPIYDIVRDTRDMLAHREKIETSNVQKLIEAVPAMLEEFLAVYNIEPFRHEQGAPFDKQQMRPLQRVPTSDQALHLTVYRSCQSGFRQGGRILRPEAVLLNVFKEVMPGKNEVKVS